MHIDGAGSEVVAPGQGDPGLPAPGQQGPEDYEGGPHPSHQFERGLGDQLVGGNQPEGTILPADVTPEVGEDVAHQRDVVDLGHVGELMSPGSEDGGDHLLESCVLRAADSNSAAEPVPALYGDLGHPAMLRREQPNLVGVPS